MFFGFTLFSDYQNESAGKDSVATTSTRTSKWNETNFSWPGARVNSCKSEDSDKQLLRLAQDWPGSVQTTPLLHNKAERQNIHTIPATLPVNTSVISPSKSEHQYDVPWSHLLPRKQLAGDPVDLNTSIHGAPNNDYSDIVTDNHHERSSPWSVSDDTSLSSNSGSVTGLEDAKPIRGR